MSGRKKRRRTGAGKGSIADGAQVEERQPNVSGDAAGIDDRQEDWSDVMSPERIRRIMRMRLIDNTLMKAVFDKCPDAAELLLRAILGRTDIRVRDVRSEQELHNTIYREIRIDIDAEDEKGVRYDIEIQRWSDGSCPTGNRSST